LPKVQRLPSPGSHAEALRRSMLAIINKGEPGEAHPAYWAPVVVVGEGASTRWPIPSMLGNGPANRSS